MIVAPDAGGVERARAFAKRLNAGLAIIDKRRDGPNVAVFMHLIGDVRGQGRRDHRRHDRHRGHAGPGRPGDRARGRAARARRRVHPSCRARPRAHQGLAPRGGDLHRTPSLSPGAKALRELRCSRSPRCWPRPSAASTTRSPSRAVRLAAQREWTRHGHRRAPSIEDSRDATGMGPAPSRCAAPGASPRCSTAATRPQASLDPRDVYRLSTATRATQLLTHIRRGPGRCAHGRHPRFAVRSCTEDLSTSTCKRWPPTAPSRSRGRPSRRRGRRRAGAEGHPQSDAARDRGLVLAFPHSRGVEADVSALMIGDVLTVRDLRAPEGVRVLTRPARP